MARACPFRSNFWTDEQPNQMLFKSAFCPVRFYLYCRFCQMGANYLHFSRPPGHQKLRRRGINWRFSEAVDGKKESIVTVTFCDKVLSKAFGKIFESRISSWSKAKFLRYSVMIFPDFRQILSRHVAPGEQLGWPQTAAILFTLCRASDGLR